MEFTGGYIRIYRKLMDNPIWTQLTPGVLKVALYCILRANYRPIQWYDGVETVEIPAGSFVTSYAKTAAACGLSIQQIRDSFSHLERTHFTTCRRTHRWTLVTVLNYEAYQATSEDQNTPENTQKNTWENRQGTTNEELKNIYTPSRASDDASVAGAPLVLISSEASRKPARTVSRKPYADVLEQVARSIHDRHPNGFERRNLSAAAVEKKLGTILKYRRVSTAEAEAYLRRIDRNHVGACASDGWTKDGGQYAKGLRGWLSTREELYDVEPAMSARKEPRLMLA
jgi:hypothetical protein